MTLLAVGKLPPIADDLSRGFPWLCWRWRLDFPYLPESEAEHEGWAEGHSSSGIVISTGVGSAFTSTPSYAVR